MIKARARWLLFDLVSRVLVCRQTRGICPAHRNRCLHAYPWIVSDTVNARKTDPQEKASYDKKQSNLDGKILWVSRCHCPYMCGLNACRKVVPVTCSSGLCDLPIRASADSTFLSDSLKSIEISISIYSVSLAMQRMRELGTRNMENC